MSNTTENTVNAILPLVCMAVGLWMAYAVIATMIQSEAKRVEREAARHSHTATLAPEARP